HPPVVALPPGQLEVIHSAGGVLGVGRLKPAVDRLVVMGAGVGDAAARIVVGQVVAAVPAVKGEFHHLHARVAGGGQQIVHILGQEPQVFGNDVLPAQLLLDGAEQVDAGAG